MRHKGQFAPGNKLAAGNHAPRGRFITQRLIAMMHEEVTVLNKEEGKNGKKGPGVQRRVQRLVLFCETLFNLALEGDMQAIKYIADRIEGTPIQTTIMAEDFDPERMQAERKRLDEARANLSKLTDGERTALYFQTLKQVTGTSGSAPSSH